LNDEQEPSDGALRTLVHRCARNLARQNIPGYFIVDGLHHIPDDDNSFLQAIMALLPFGIKPFRFLLSSDNTKDIFSYNRALQVKSFVLTTFTSHESDEFLSDIIPDKARRADYHKTACGVPGLLASARRQLLAQSSDKHPPSLPRVPDISAFVEAEWDLLVPLSEPTETVVSYILAYGRPVSSTQLSQHTDLSPDHVDTLLHTIPFLTHSTNLGGWDFTSEPFRQYAEAKLFGRVQAATEALAKKHLQDPDSDESLSLLPQYLERIENSDKIFAWFDERRLAKILLKARTPAWTEPILRRAIAISHDSRNDRALTTYSILRSIIPQLSHTTGITHEIRARCVLGDFVGAHAVANNVPLLSQRLRLLAVLVDAASEIPGTPTQPLKEEIRELLAQVDLDGLPTEEAIDIAIDLYPVDPRAASSLLKATITDAADHDSVDIALARITVAALQSQHAMDSSINRIENAPKSTDVLVDERIRKFVEAARISVNARSGAEVLSLTADIVEPAERLFILRAWIGQHPNDRDVLSVMETTLNEGIATSQFTPTATFYREVLTPLPRAADREARARLIAMLDAQKPVIQAKGPTIDYVRTQLLLAFANYADHDQRGAVDRLEDLYLECLCDIPDLETRTAALAWCLAELANYDPTNQLDRLSQFRELVDRDFADAVASVINDGADQFVILEKALQPLAIHLPTRAIAIVSSFNTSYRRNQGRLRLITVMCDDLVPHLDFTLLFELVDGMDAGPTLDLAIATIAERIAEHIRGDLEYTTEVTGLLSRFERCSSASTRTEYLGHVAAALGEATASQPLFHQVKAQLFSDFDGIGSPRDRYTTGCKLIVLLHPSCPQLASRVFGLFSEQNEVSRVGDNVEEGSFYILDLLIKATCALARADLLRGEDLSRIRNMVAEVRDPYLRIRLLSRLAFFFWCEKRQTDFAAIVTEEIWPALDAVAPGDHALMYRAWSHAYGVVWLENRDRARDAIRTYPRVVRNGCISNLCLSLLRKQPLGEPFDNRRNKSSAVLDYSDIRNLLNLCDETDDDTSIFVIFQGIADQISQAAGAPKITKEQKAEIGRLMTTIANVRLPLAAGIQHLGFQIVCRGQALRVSGANTEQWRELIVAGENLPNSADRAFVLALLASYLPNRLKNERARLFDISEKATELLQSIEDRYQRYSAIAEAGLSTDRLLATRVTEKAFRTITRSDDNRNANRERRLIELAYRVDPELPMKMALLYDDDPAKEQYRDRAKRQLARQELKKELGDHKQDIVLRDRQNEPDLATAAWLALGTLNAGLMTSVDMTRVRDMVACASNYPLAGC